GADGVDPGRVLPEGGPRPGGDLRAASAPGARRGPGGPARAGPPQWLRAGLPAAGAARAAAHEQPRRAGRAAAAELVRAGLAGPRGRAALPRGDVHALGGPLRAGIPPLVRAVPVPAGRAALH